MYINEHENQLIIRFPEKLSQKVNEMFEKEVGEEIEITPFLSINNKGEEVSSFNIKIDNRNYEGVLTELPCVIESFKTIDDINLIKSNNISQMILVNDNPNTTNNTSSNIEEIIKNNPNIMKISEKNERGRKKAKYLHKDGLTPPTKGVREKYFRKDIAIPTADVKNIESQMIENLKDIKIDKKGDYVDVYSNRYKNDYYQSNM